MSGDRPALHSGGYDRMIRQTIPFYDEFFDQIIELVNVLKTSAVKWLDIGCGTGRMGSAALEGVELEKFVFCDVSGEMIQAARERFLDRPAAEFLVCDARDLEFVNEFDVITAIQVNHYLRGDGRKNCLERCYRALKKGGVLISFENFAPFTDAGRAAYLEKWKRYQRKQGKSLEESAKHIERYGREYFPITVEEHLSLLRGCGFATVEILWLSNMQAGFWGIKE